MKKSRARGFIIGGVVLLVLIGALIALPYLPTAEAEPSSSTYSTPDSIPIVSVEEDSFKSAEIKNEYGTIKITKSGDAYTISDLNGLPEDASLIGSAATKARNISSTRLVDEKPSDLKQYGLDKPQATVKVSSSDGDKTFEIGAYTAGNSEMYVKSAEGAVYVVYKSTLEPFLMPLTYYVDKTLTAFYPKYDAEAGLLFPPYKSITLGGTGREQEINIIPTVKKEDDDTPVFYSYEMTSPRKTSVDSAERVLKLMDLFGIKADETIALRPTEEELEGYGLKEPVYTIKASYEEDDFKGTLDIKLGNTKDGRYYAMTGDVPVVYAVSEGAIPIAKAGYMDLIPRLVFIPYINKVSTLTLDLDGKSYKFELVTNEEDELTVTMGGETISSDIFRKFYQLLIYVTADEELTEEVSGRASIKMTYDYNDGKKSDVLELIPYGTRKLAIVLNGEGMYSMRGAYVDKVRAEFTHLLNGEAVDTDW